MLRRSDCNFKLETDMRHRHYLLSLAIFVIGVPSARGQAALQGTPKTVDFDSRYISTQVVHQVEPDFPWSPQYPKESVPYCQFEVVIDVDGTLISATTPNPCAEPFFSSAKRAIRGWT
jgi:hypothetical protein